MHPSTLWPADAVQLADEALAKLADAATVAGKITSEQLPHALRHVSSEMVAAIFAKAPGLWGDALEAFASAPLARVLFVSISDIPAQHRLRAMRLIAATLGEEAVPLLVSRAAEAPVDERLEMLFLAIGLGGEQHLGRLEQALEGMKFADLLRQRAKWHLQNRGVVPTVRGLKVARATAVIPLADRATKCRQAADDLGALTRFARHPEAYLYAMWGWMVRGAADPVRARELVAAHPESQKLVRELYLEDLARRGRVKQLMAAAQTLKGADLGALHLAVHGRPFAALELAAGAAYAYGDQLAAAQARFERLLRDAPGNLDVRHELGNVYRWRGWLDRSVLEYRRVLAVAPDLLAARIGYSVQHFSRLFHSLTGKAVRTVFGLRCAVD